MALASKKKPAPPRRKPAKANPSATAQKAKKAATAPATPDPLADIEEPDRSAPQLAEVDADALEFIAAIDRFKKEHGRPFPSWSEILLVVRQLGYRRS